MHYVLHVKPSTSNYIVIGDSGKFLPSVYCKIYVMCFLNRLHHMESHRIPRQVYDEMVHLSAHGFNNWTTKVYEMVNTYNLDVNLHPELFKINCKKVVLDNFLDLWYRSVSDIVQNPILRTYTEIKLDFEMSPHLYMIKNARFRVAMTKLRASSHTLEIEKGRHYTVVEKRIDYAMRVM